MDRLKLFLIPEGLNVYKTKPVKNYTTPTGVEPRPLITIAINI